MWQLKFWAKILFSFINFTKKFVFCLTSFFLCQSPYVLRDLMECKFSILLRPNYFILKTQDRWYKVIGTCGLNNNSVVLNYPSLRPNYVSLVSKVCMCQGFRTQNPYAQQQPQDEYILILIRDVYSSRSLASPQRRVHIKVGYLIYHICVGSSWLDWFRGYWPVKLHNVTIISKLILHEIDESTQAYLCSLFMMYQV